MKWVPTIVCAVLGPLVMFVAFGGPPNLGGAFALVIVFALAAYAGWTAAN